LAMSSVLHYKKTSIKKIKTHLINKKNPIRI